MYFFVYVKINYIAYLLGQQTRYQFTYFFKNHRVFSSKLAKYVGNFYWRFQDPFLRPKSNCSDTTTHGQQFQKEFEIETGKIKKKQKQQKQQKGQQQDNKKIGQQLQSFT